jgi:signal transduction histidine kinase
MGRCLQWLRTYVLRAPRFARTSSFRLTLLYGGLFSLSALVLFGVIYWLATSYIEGQIDAVVKSEIAEEQADADGRGLAGLREVVSAQAEHASPGVYYRLEDASGHVLAGNTPPMAPVLGVREWSLRSGIGVRGRGIRAPEGGYLLVGLADANLVELRFAIANAFFWVLVWTIGLALLCGAFMSFSVLSRIEGISRTSRRIIAGDLGQRIELRGTNDEFDHLAASLNAMLDRIQALMEGLRQVSTDIAHDLRTPLSRHRQRLELARLQAKTPDELRAALDGSIRDVDSILETFGALLRIGKIGSGADAGEFTLLDIGEVVENVVEPFRAVADEQSQHLEFVRPSLPSIRANQALLTQLFANLIENALRHTPAGTTISVKAGTESGMVSVSICDDGPGVPGEFHDKTFRPFYRLDTSRTTPGTGLGLSLVAAIADLHGARIEVSDNAPGLCVRLSFALPTTTIPAGARWHSYVQRFFRRWLPNPLDRRAMDLLDGFVRVTDRLAKRVWATNSKQLAAHLLQTVRSRSTPQHQFDGSEDTVPRSTQVCRYHVGSTGTTSA